MNRCHGQVGLREPEMAKDRKYWDPLSAVTVRERDKRGDTTWDRVGDDVDERIVSSDQDKGGNEAATAVADWELRELSRR